MARKKKTIEQQVQQGLSQLAFGDIADAVSLLFFDEQTIIEKLPTLNLFNISEIKRPKGGGMEIKFFDRIKALEKLGEVTAKESENSLSFYEALEKSAKSCSNQGDYNG
jgi:hypothetical protein